MNEYRDLIRLVSTPELGTEIWVDINGAWIMYQVRNHDGTHKEWRIRCTKNHGDYVAGEEMEDSYQELWKAKKELLTLIKESDNNPEEGSRHRERNEILIEGIKAYAEKHKSVFYIEAFTIIMEEMFWGAEREKEKNE